MHQVRVRPNAERQYREDPTRSAGHGSRAFGFTMSVVGSLKNGAEATAIKEHGEDDAASETVDARYKEPG